MFSIQILVLFIISLFGILNAKQPNIPQYSSHVTIEHRTRGTSKQVCSGVLITKNFILTAAHCIPSNDFKNDEWYVKAGAIDAFLTKGEFLQVKKVKAVYPHPNYDGSALSPFNIALIQLKEKIRFTRYVNSMRLPKGNLSTPRGTAVSIGFVSQQEQKFGVTAPSIGDFLEIVSRDECHKAYHNVADSQMCLKIKHPTCDRDIGGPIAQALNSLPTVVGIHSYRKTNCGSQLEVGIQIAPFVNDFINPVIRPHRG